ncbi:hypothetical protein CAPTEDRAFT_38846, partial [Capitella teleta]
EVQIADGSTGHDFKTILEEPLKFQFTKVQVDDPHIKLPHQIENFSHLCDVLVESQPKVKSLHLSLRTCEAKEGFMRVTQNQKLKLLKQRLLDQGVILFLEPADPEILHDRGIRFNNGWVVYLGRGLDIFKK